MPLTAAQAHDADRLGAGGRQPDRDAARPAARRPARPDRRRLDLCPTRTCWSTPRPDRAPASSARRSSSTARPTATRSSGAQAIATLYSDADHGDREPRRHAAERRLQRRPGGGVHLRPRPLGRLHAPGQPGLGRAESATARRRSQRSAPTTSSSAPRPATSQPDWVDLNKVAIPQADEQQRLLANLIEQMNLETQAAAAVLVPAREAEGRRGHDRRRPRQRRHGRPVRPVRVATARRAARSPTGSACAARPTSTRARRSRDAQAADLPEPGLRDRAARDHQLRELDARRSSRTSTRASSPPSRPSYPSVPAPADQPHALHRLERLGDPAEGRAGARHPPRHQLLLLAGGLGPGPPGHVHRAPACRCASPTSTAR